MPAVGFGTCCRAADHGRPLVDSTKTYFDLGGRLIDTAQIYNNHWDLGAALRETTVPREDIWVTTKLNSWNSHSEDDVRTQVDLSLQELGLGYINLMLLHGGEKYIDPERDVALWQGLITAKREGKIRSIGVSNHIQEEIKNLINRTGEVPAVNQLEYHPWVPTETKELVRWCQDQGIAVTAYGSLGGSANKAQSEAVTAVAQKYGVGNAQVLLRWALDQGVAVIPGATSEGHIREDLDVADLRLNSEDMKFIESSAAPADWTRWHNCIRVCPV